MVDINIKKGEHNFMIADFGFSTYLGFEEKCHSKLGTRNYVAPEICNEEKYGKAVDIWSLGIVFYTIYFGRFPYFKSKDNQKL